MSARFYIFVLLIFFGFQLTSQKSIPVIPQPRVAQVVSDSFNLSQTLKLAFPQELKQEAHYLQKELFAKKGLFVTFEQDAKKANILLQIEKSKKPVDGAYKLKMSAHSIEITGDDAEGVFHGIQTLLQLVSVSKEQLACWNVEDSPEFTWRGFMLDESRHFFGKEKVKQLLDYMAFYKLNRFHWHLTDEPGWRIEIKKYPLLAFTGGVGNYLNPDAAPKYYTQDEISEIVQYAAERKIEVIPEIDMPGHARAANRAYPQFSGGGSEKHPEFTFDPGKEETYQYLTDILKEVNTLFPSEMIHLGGDEVHYGNEMWKTNPGIQELMQRENLKDLPEVEKYFMVRMADSLFAMNNHFLAWDEMAEIALPTEKTLIFWWRHDRKDQLQKALNKDYSVVLCPRIPFYFDFVQAQEHRVGRKWWQGQDYSSLEKVYSFDVSNYLESTKNRPQVKGFQANLWTETVGTEQRLDFMIFPRLSALAEAAWGQNKDYENYLEKLKLHLLLYKKEGIYYFNPFNPAESPEPRY